MVRGDVADSFHIVGGKPLVRIKIVKVRNPLIRLTAKFSEVMSRCCARRQRKINWNPRRIKPLGCHHRNIVDTGDMSQRLERGRLTV